MALYFNGGVSLEASIRKRQYGNGNLETSIRKWQLGNVNTEMATWKRQYGNLHITWWGNFILYTLMWHEHISSSYCIYVALYVVEPHYNRNGGFQKYRKRSKNRNRGFLKTHNRSITSTNIFQTLFCIYVEASTCCNRTSCEEYTENLYTKIIYWRNFDGIYDAV